MTFDLDPGLALLESPDWEYDEQMFPPYRAFIRCLACDAPFETGEEYLAHMPEGFCS